jgi:hypothetical protein
MDLVHQKENNVESQARLDAVRPNLNKKCTEVLTRLQNGERLTVLGCAIDGIASLPRRILDLKQAGYSISDEWEKGRKVYFIK